jgi:K(+)-stimulated pyrophosphate-energized sodium pump
MKLLHLAARPAVRPASPGRSSRRALSLLTLAGLGTLLPQAAHAAEGENIRLRFGGSDYTFLIIALVMGVLSLVYGFYLVGRIMKESPGGEGMQRVGKAIKDGALAYLRKQIGTMAIFVLLLFVGLILLNQSSGWGTAVSIGVSFVFGVLGSYLAGYTGMVMAVNANMRVAQAAMSSYKRSLEVAFRSGAVAGLVTVGIGLIGATTILMIGGEAAVRMLVGFGFGGSLAALFMRVGGGIFTKAADVGADLVGKVEAGIPEDDPRNPAVIADNVGDNVGDCAGMAADVFESYEVTLISAIILAAATAAVFDQQTWTRLVLFALMTAAIGIFASMVGIASVRGSDDLDADPLVPIRRGFLRSALLSLLLTGAASYVMMGGLPRVFPGIQSTQLVSTRQYEQEETAYVQRLRQEIAKRQVNAAAIQSAVAAKATELKRDAKQITAADLYSDPTKIPTGLVGVPQAAAAKVIANDKTPLKPYEITSNDLVNTKELKDRGYQATDEPQVAQMLSTNLATLPEPAELKGYQRVTNPSDPNVPALNYATLATQQPGAPSSSPFTTVGAAFTGTGRDQLVVKQVHVKADLPARPGANGQPPSPAVNVDRVQWYGPAPAGQLEDQIKQQQDVIKQQKINATIQERKTLPVQLYHGPNGRLALVVPDEVDKPQQLRPAVQLSYFAADVPTLQKVQQQATSGQPPATPPQEQIELAVAKTNAVPWWGFLLAFTTGLALALAIEKLTEFYVSTHKRPVQEVAGVSSGGAAPMIIQGFAFGSESSAMMVLILVIALLCPLFIFPAALYGGYVLGLYGIALVGLGLLSTTGYVLAMDTFGPISDNAQGVYEMSGEGHDNATAAKAVGRLDAAGNTTKALTKGFAIATAVVAAIALFHSFLEGARLSEIGLKLDVPEIFLGLLIGGAAPYLFSAFAINAVGRSAFQLINEVRRQFREDPGIMKGTSTPDYARCVAIVTAAAQKELLGPGILAIALPAAVGFGFSIGKAPVEINGSMYNLTGAQALGGFLAGAILSGQLLAVLLSNSGGMWDNAKKLIEDGLHGGKGSEAHKASVICDTVGDPFKDTAGPALNPLIKVMNLVALLLAGVIIQPFGNGVLITVTLICVAALAFAVIMSKKGSLSADLQQAQAAGERADNHFSSAALDQPAPAPAPAKKRITVEDDTP